MKKLLLLLIFGMFCINLASAFDFANVKIYQNATNTIKVDSGILGIIPIDSGNEIASYTLDKVDNSVIKSYAEGSVTIYDSRALFSGVGFRNIKGQLQGLSNVKFYIYINNSFQVVIPDFISSCSTLKNGTSVCQSVQKGSHNETRYKASWQQYTLNTNLPQGTYKWRLEANRNPNQAVDFILNAQGKDFTEWAWWNNSWSYKQPINLSTSSGYTGINYSVRLNVTYSSHMNSNFSDLRFINGSENTELGYWLNVSGTINGSYADVFVRIPDNITTTNQTIYMYYGNTGTTTTSSCPNAFLFCDLADAENSGQYTINTQPSGAIGGSGSTTLTFYQSITAYNYSVQANSQAWAISPLNVTSGAIQIDVQTKNDGANNPQIVVGLWHDTSLAQGTNYGQFIAYHLINQTGASQNDLGGVGTTGTTTTNTWQMNRVIFDLDIGMINSSLTPTDNFDKNTTAPVFYGNPAINFYQNGGGNALQIGQWFVKRYSSVIPTTYFGTETLNAFPQFTNPSPSNITNYSTNQINLSQIVIDYGYNLISVNLSINGTLNQTNISGINNTAYNFSITAPEGYTRWKYNATDSNGGSNSSSEFWFLVDTIQPTMTSNMTFIPYQIINTNLPVYINTSDANLNACWYDLNGVNTTFTCSNNYTLINTTNYNINNLTAWVNDSVGHTISLLINWTYGVFQNNQNFNPSTTGGNLENFYIDFNSISNNGAILWYNGSNHTSIVNNLGSNEYNATNLITIPNINGSVYPFWQININSTYNINTTNFTQIINAISVDDCSVNTRLLLNDTLLDQESRNILNTSLNPSLVEINLSIQNNAGTNIIGFAQNYTNNTNPKVCINLNDLGISQYNLSYIQRFSASSYAPEFSNMQIFTITNTSIPYNLNLSDLNSSVSTQFLVTLKGTNSLALSNALINLTRKFVSIGDYRSIEIPTSDTNGQAYVHINTNNVLYRISIEKNGTILGVFDITPVCENILTQTCNININLAGSSNYFPDFNTTNDLYYIDPTFNSSSRNITFSWASLSGANYNISLNVTQFNATNNTICLTSQLSSGSTLTCNVPFSYGNQTFIYTIYKNGQIFLQGLFSISPSPNQLWGGSGTFLAFGFILTIALMFVGNPIGMVIGTIMGLILCGALLLIATGSWIGIGGVITWFIIAGGILIWKLSRQG